MRRRGVFQRPGRGKKGRESEARPYSGQTRRKNAARPGGRGDAVPESEARPFPLLGGVLHVHVAARAGNGVAARSRAAPPAFSLSLQRLAARQPQRGAGAASARHSTSSSRRLPPRPAPRPASHLSPPSSDEAVRGSPPSSEWLSKRSMMFLTLPGRTAHTRAERQTRTKLRWLGK